MVVCGRMSWEDRRFRQRLLRCGYVKTRLRCEACSPASSNEIAPCFVREPMPGAMCLAQDTMQNGDGGEWLRVGSSCVRLRAPTPGCAGKAAFGLAKIRPLRDRQDE